MAAMRGSLFVLVIIASMRAVAEGAASHESPAISAAPEGVWCFDVSQTGPVTHVLTGDLRARGASLWYSRSHDGGYRWTNPVRVDAGLPAPQPSNAEHARIAWSGDRLLAVWRVDGMRSVMAVSPDNGRTWRREDPPNGDVNTKHDSPVVPDREPALVHSSDMARAPDGMLAAVWQEPGGRDLPSFLPCPPTMAKRGRLQGG